MKKNFIEKMFWQFMVPSVLSAVGLSAANIADSLVVGIRAGDAGLAAIGITVPIYMAYALFYVGIGIGGSVEYSRLLGAGKKNEGLSVFNMMMELSLAIGLAFSICGIFFTREVLWLLGTAPSDGELYRLSYQYARILLISAPIFFVNTPLYIFIKNDDNPKLASLGYVAGNILDVALNFILVILLDVGIQGSVWATVIGQMAAVCIYIPHLAGRKHILKAYYVKPDFKKTLQSFKIGFATSNQYISQFVFILLANRILMAKAGQSGVAVFDVVLNVSYVAPLFFQAAGEAVQPLASTFHGEGNAAAERKAYKLAMGYGMAFGICLLTAAMPAAGRICVLFGISGEDAILMGMTAVRIYCAGAVFAGINMIAASFNQAVGRDGAAYLISISRGALFLLPYTLLFGLFPTELFFLLFPAAEISTFLLYLAIKALRLKRGETDAVPEERICSMLLDNSRNSLSEVLASIEEFCGKFKASARQGYYVTMTVEELCGAIMEHAFTEKDEGLYILITVIARKEGDFRLCIRDNAVEFNPFGLETKKAEIDDSEDVLSGLGIMMVKSKAKEFYYRRYQNFNTLAVLV